MDKLSRGSLLARNTILNFIGQGAPILVALFAIPLLVNGLGTDRFGVLMLAWVVIGYFGLFDLGLSRALTKLVAEKLGTQEEQEIPTLVWTALFLLLIVGLVGTLVVSLLSPWLVRDALNIPEVLQPETLSAFYLLALFIPVLISTVGLQGVLKAYQRFDLISAVRVPMGVFVLLGPLLVLPFSQSLFLVVAVLVAGLLIAWLVHWPLCFYALPTLRECIKIKGAMARRLLRFGSWMTITNVVGPLMVYLDRFLISVLASVTAVAYYTTPYEVATKLWLIPGALVGVLFPAFASGFSQDRNRMGRLFGRGVKYIFLALFPITLFMVTFAHEGLDIWLGAEFAENSTRVLQWLAVGVFINSLSQIPFALVQGAGRPDLTAKLHLTELPFYLLAVWWMVTTYGIAGAAIAWVARVAADALLLFAMAKRFLPTRAAAIWRMVFTMGAALFILALATLLVSTAMKGFFLLLTLLTFALAAWFLILAPEERMLVRNRLKIVHALN